MVLCETKATTLCNCYYRQEKKRKKKHQVNEWGTSLFQYAARRECVCMCVRISVSLSFSKMSAATNLPSLLLTLTHDSLTPACIQSTMNRSILLRSVFP